MSDTERAVLWAILESRETTRARIGELVGISKPTVGNAVAVLREAQLIKTVRSQQGSLGRAAAVYAMSANAGIVVGLTVESSMVRALALTMNGAEIAATSEKFDETSHAQMSELIRAQVQKVLSAASVDSQNIRAMGVAVERIIPTYLKEAVSSRPNLPSIMELIDCLELPANVPLLIENTANCAAMAELEFGKPRIGNFVYLHVGLKLGSGIVADERILRGASGGAGEVSYLPMELLDFPHETRPAALERHLGLPQVLRRAITSWNLSEGRAPSSIEELFEAASRGVESARRSLQSEADKISRIALALAAVVDPASIVLDGELGGHPTVLEHVRGFVQEIRPTIQVHAGTLGEKAIASGIAAIALDRSLADLVGPRYLRTLHQGVATFENGDQVV